MNAGDVLVRNKDSCYFSYNDTTPSNVFLVLDVDSDNDNYKQAFGLYHEELQPPIRMRLSLVYLEKHWKKL